MAFRLPHSSVGKLLGDAGESALRVLRALRARRAHEQNGLGLGMTPRFIHMPARGAASWRPGAAKGSPPLCISSSASRMFK